jgi:hypothetical protein
VLLGSQAAAPVAVQGLTQRPLWKLTLSQTYPVGHCEAFPQPHWLVLGMQVGVSPPQSELEWQAHSSYVALQVSVPGHCAFVMQEPQ